LLLCVCFVSSAEEERKILDSQELLELKGLALDGVETRIKDATQKINQMAQIQEELLLARKVPQISCTF